MDLQKLTPAELEAYFDIQHFVILEGKVGFNTGDLKRSLCNVWSRTYAKVWRQIRNAARAAIKQGYEAMFYQGGKYYYSQF